MLETPFEVITPNLEAHNLLFIELYHNLTAE